MKTIAAAVGAMICLLLVIPVSALHFVDETKDYEYCEDMNLFFWNDSSSLGSEYGKISTKPQMQDSKLLSVDVSQSTGEKTIATFVTEPFVGGKVLAPGLTRYRTYLNVSSAVGVTTYNFIPYNVSADGTTFTRMFFGVPRTEEVNELDAREYLTSYARRNYTYFLDGERLAIRVNASTTSTTPMTAIIIIAGVSQASMVSVGYWMCDAPQRSDAGVTVAIVFGIVGGLFGAIVIARRGKR